MVADYVDAVRDGFWLSVFADRSYTSVLIRDSPLAAVGYHMCCYCELWVVGVFCVLAWRREKSDFKLWISGIADILMPMAYLTYLAEGILDMKQNTLLNYVGM